MHRSRTTPSQESGGAWGGELRVHPYSRHGLLVGFTHAEGVFGPRVSIIDATYSLRILGGLPLTGLTSAAYLDFGPAVGFVSDAGSAPDHTVLGARASAAFDLQLANFSVGALAGYRGGVPLAGPDDRWEGAFSAMLRLGLVFDISERKSAQ